MATTTRASKAAGWLVPTAAPRATPLIARRSFAWSSAKLQPPRRGRACRPRPPEGALAPRACRRRPCPRRRARPRARPLPDRAAVDGDGRRRRGPGGGARRPRVLPAPVCPRQAFHVRRGDALEHREDAFTHRDGCRQTAEANARGQFHALDAVAEGLDALHAGVAEGESPRGPMSTASCTRTSPMKVPLVLPASVTRDAVRAY